MSAGRRPSIDLRDPQNAEKFRKMILDVKANRLPIGVMAAEFGVSTKTIRRNIEAIKDQDQAAQTYRQVDRWEQVPGAVEWENKMKARMKPSSCDPMIASVKRIWADPELWNKKLLSLLTADDMARAVAWAKKRADSFQQMKCLRSLVRLGFGDHSWLTDFMGTKGTKGPPRFPPELKTRETFLTVVPRLNDAKKQMLDSGEISMYEYQTSIIVDFFKLKHGARTGEAKEERAVWGTRINAGKSSLIVDPDGKVRHWTDFSKNGRVWEINREQFEIYPGFLPALEAYIAINQLKTGDYLIRKLSRDRARDILKRACEIAGLSHFVLHDFRKIALTDKRLAKVPLEVAVKMGEGWDDVATAAKFYESIKDIDFAPEFAKIKAFYQNGGAKYE